jgi:subtilisin family serine protease
MIHDLARTPGERLARVFVRTGAVRFLTRAQHTRRFWRKAPKGQFETVDGFRRFQTVSKELKIFFDRLRREIPSRLPLFFLEDFWALGQRTVESVKLHPFSRRILWRGFISQLLGCSLLLQSHLAGAEMKLKRYDGAPGVAENIAYSVDAGDWYSTPKGKRSLKRIAGLVVVATEAGVKIAAVDGVNYTTHTETAAGLTILAAPDHVRKAQRNDPAESARALAALRDVPGVISANPVFLDPDSGRWLILAQSVIVKLKAGVDHRVYFGADRARVRPLLGTTDQFILSMATAPAEEIFAEVNRRAADPAVEWAEPDVIGEMVKHATPDDPFFAQQWALHNTGARARADADIDAPEAWNVTTGSPDVVIAILDDAVQIDHPDLTANILQNPGENLNGVDDDNNGYIDDINGWDFVNNDNNPGPGSFAESHGTACAGVAAAVGNNGMGVAGAAYNCRILPIRMYGVPVSTLAQSIYYAAGRSSDGLRRWRGADILSLSLATPQNSAVDAAFNWAAVQGRGGKGCPIFAASGNEASRWQTFTLHDVPPGTHTYEWWFQKDIDTSYGADTAWIDGVIFPDGSSESFEGTTLPPGWTTFGDAAWYSVQDNVNGNHALTGWSGAAARALRAGEIFDFEVSALSVTKDSAATGDLIFRLWVSAEEGYDGVFLYADGRRIAFIDDDPFEPAVTTIGYPARHPEVIAVGASTDFDFRADYSTYHGKLDFVAPSGGGYANIWTTDLVGAAGSEDYDYDPNFSGTSAACPLAAGVAALVLSVNTNLSAQNVRRLMQATCDKIGNVTYMSNTNLYYGHGRINAAAAVSNAVPRITSVQTNASSVIIRFRSVRGWTYNLERATAISGPWAIARSNIAGTGAEVTVTDTRVATPAMGRYYRLRVLPQGPLF